MREHQNVWGFMPPGPRRRLAPPATGGNRERQHLRHRPRVDAKPTRRLTPTEPLYLNRVADLPIQLHELHPRPSVFNTESFCCWSFTPAQPDNPAASVRDF